MSNPATFTATFREDAHFTASFRENTQMAATFKEQFLVIDPDYYTGEYEITPAAEAQVIPIAGLAAERDITVKPIPSNWGRISWDGATLTVS